MLIIKKNTSFGLVLNNIFIKQNSKNILHFEGKKHGKSNKITI